MTSPSVNLQDSFLNHVRKENVEVEVVLSNGVSLQGGVRGFDNFTVVMHVEGKQHLVYKHAIAQIVAPKFARNSQAPAKEPKDGEAPHDKGPRRRPPSRAKEPETPSAPAAPAARFNALDLSGVKVGEDTVKASAE